jgi:hypothetical protein
MNPEQIYLVLVGHQEMMLTYSVRNQRIARELNEYINQQLDILWDNKIALMELGLLDDLMGNVKELARLAIEQGDLNVASADAQLDTVQKLLGVTNERV